MARVNCIHMAPEDLCTEDRVWIPLAALDTAHQGDEHVAVDVYDLATDIHTGEVTVLAEMPDSDLNWRDNRVVLVCDPNDLLLVERNRA